jgi:PAS domain S-box-containing protein
MAMDSTSPHDPSPSEGDGALLTALVARLSDAAVVTSGEGVVIEANDRFCRLAGFDRDALVGRMIPLLDGVPSVSGADPRELVELTNWIASVVVVCADGAPTNVLASVERIHEHPSHGDTYLICVRLSAVPVARLVRHRKPPRTAPTTSARQWLNAASSSEQPRTVSSEVELAMGRSEFFARYQPIVSLHDGRIEAFEALLRWHHPIHGVLGPGAFIGEAESRGVLAQLTHEILSDACQDAAHWNDIRAREQPVCVSVNLCGSQLRDPLLIESIEKAIAASRLAPSRLWLEINENTGVTEAARDPALLDDIRSLGVKLVLDDFGTGYASLGSVRKLPLDILKFDRSLVSGAAEHRCDARILAAGIEIARALEIDVIAEGIEHRIQLEYLRSLDCASGQGYYFSRPVDRERADLLVAAERNWLEETAPERGCADTHAA